MYDGVWSEAFEGRFKKRIVAQVTDKELNLLTGELVPKGNALMN
jgi:hypothetical protein